ncbi:hypothetical protein C5167_036139 [Papaver somniferum]|nr:hypothetical protein C5167_036139 [Papaver somniferum]
MQVVRVRFTCIYILNYLFLDALYFIQFFCYSDNTRRSAPLMLQKLGCDSDYDGYRIEKCRRKVGIQDFKMCMYSTRDNEPAPLTSDVHGDCPRLVSVI